LVILDCITLLVSDLLLRDERAAGSLVDAEIEDLLSIIKSNPVDWIVVSNEVGLGLVPEYPLGRIYRDLLGRANQQLAAHAKLVFWMVAGIPVPVEQYRD
jgi:adenosylcobinamide kinase/adenosylcobinamide-phosphate guanylyltransferase